MLPAVLRRVSRSAAAASSDAQVNALRIVAAACACLLACRGSTGVDAAESSSSSATTSSSTTSDESSSTAVALDGPPQVLDIGRSVLSLTTDESTVLTAFVDHPRGDAAVVRGTLFGPGEPAEYGEFLRGDGGRWSIEVGWDDFDAHGDLSFEGELLVELVARFVDDRGEVGERATELPLRCSTISPTACDGSCADLDSSNLHCGGCDRPCVEQFPDPFVTTVGGCAIGSCRPVWSACAEPLVYEDCNAVCGAAGSSCVQGGCGERTMLPVADESDCGETIAVGELVSEPDDCETALSGFAARCCCSQ
jgi:hypothetical protein